MQIKSIKQYLEFLKHSGIQDIYLNSEKVKDSYEEVHSSVSIPIPIPSNIEEPSLIDPAIKLKDLEQKYSNCNKCSLAKIEHQYLYGKGNPHAKLMLINFSSDNNNDIFTGEAGQLLTNMLKAIKLNREDIYITNIIKCSFPQGQEVSLKEKQECRVYLDEQIDVIQPQLILILGHEAATMLLGKNISLEDFRKNTYLYKNVKTYVSYHPSQLIVNTGWKKFAWLDLQKLQKDYERIR